MTVLAKNRKAFHDYEIIERYEAGIELLGTEVKSCRARSISLADAHVRIRNGEAWLYGVHIAPYNQGNRFNHEPRRTRKLLLHKRELRKLAQSTQAKGLTIIPLSFLLRRGIVKVEIALCRGKAKHDKREEMKRKVHNKEAEDAMRR
ncbi:MAG: SsrA-binding protein SmpB [Verrucomicrobiota bacterium]